MRIHDLYVWFTGKTREPGVGTRMDMLAANKEAAAHNKAFHHKYVINFEEACGWLDAYAGGDKDDYVRANEHEKLVKAHLALRAEAQKEAGKELPAA